MKKNLGSMDRFARIAAGILIVGGGIVFQSWWGLIGVVPLATAFIRWCPAYTLFGINTCQKCADGEEGADCSVAG